MSETHINLFPEYITEKEKLIIKSEVFSAFVFRFESRALGLRLRNDAGELVLLPFQGQQIWSAEFAGRNLTMRSMFDQPQPTRTYLETYGGFLIHCGATAMGVPTKDDNHPLHGEAAQCPLPEGVYHFRRR